MSGSRAIEVEQIFKSSIDIRGLRYLELTQTFLIADLNRINNVSKEVEKFVKKIVLIELTLILINLEAEEKTSLFFLTYILFTNQNILHNFLKLSIYFDNREQK